MSKKSYTTPEQRDSLQSVGIKHEPGRSFKEAEALIDEQIQLGNLTPEHKVRATFRQLQKLDELKIKYETLISKEEASDLISRHEPATERQKDFLMAMGAIFDNEITKKSASDLIDQKQKTTPMSDQQAEFIESLGGYVDRTMTIGQASDFISQLLETREFCNRCFGEFDYRDTRCECGAFLPKRRRIFPDAHRDKIPFLEQVLRFFGFI